jgi:hypothetical protein
MFTANQSKSYRGLVFIILVLSFYVVNASADWMKMDPPPDVDKRTHGHSNTSTCWLVAAANMLAGAGYGSGATVQQRADSIYNQLVNTHGTGPGWADQAISAWLKSSNNTMKGINPYTVVTRYGYTTATPYIHNLQGTGFSATDDLPEFMGNELRRCQMVGVSLSWGVNTGHIITLWGDDGDANDLTDNPDTIYVTDSDGMDYYGDVQEYDFGKFYGAGWYLNYNNSPFIKHIVTLCPIIDANDPNNTTTQKIIASYKRSNPSSTSAVKVAHILASNKTILTYKMAIDACQPSLDFIYEGGQRTYLLARWDVSSYPIAQGQSVTATTEAVLPYDPNSSIANRLTNYILTFIYPSPEPNNSSPDFSFGLHSPILPGGPDIIEPNITGGYVIGAFDMYSDPAGQQLAGEFRFCAEYEYFQDPETHEFDIEPVEIYEPTWIGNFRFGHSYGLLEGSPLWNFDEWWTVEPMIQTFNMGDMPINIPINWAGMGLLPYPRGENYKAPQPTQCGDPGTEYSPYDFNKDCYIDFRDFSFIADNWLKCSNPADPNCTSQ